MLPRPAMPHVLVIHGGAGTIDRDAPQQDRYHEALRAALEAGGRVLAHGGCALDAVVEAVAWLEDCPLFNAGHGAVFTAAGTHELDAAVMEGRLRRAGGVAGVRTVRHPVRAARALLEDGRHVLLGGAGAERDAEARGLERVPNEWFATEARRAQWEGLRAATAGEVMLDHDGRNRFGTVGAVALDAAGGLAAATSTGGMTGKPPGRIGDSPVVGAGVWADDRSCAVSATGSGEHFLRACAAHDVHARIRYGGATLEAAAHAAVFESVASLGGQGGLIALDGQGRVAMPFNTTGMYRGVARSGEPAATFIF